MKKNELSYLQMPIPKGVKSYRITKREWNGLNYRQTVDSGYLSYESNVSTLKAPHIIPSQKRNKINDDNCYYNAQSKKPITLFGFDDYMIVVYKSEYYIWFDYIEFILFI